MKFFACLDVFLHHYCGRAFQQNLSCYILPPRYQHSCPFGSNAFQMKMNLKFIYGCQIIDTRVFRRYLVTKMAVSLPIKSSVFLFKGFLNVISLLNEPEERASLSIWYENRGFWVYETERHSFCYVWPLYNPSLYGSAPPVSTRITFGFPRVLTSFVPPAHNQGVSLASLLGLARWKIFLPTTGSFFVVC